MHRTADETSESALRDDVDARHDRLVRETEDYLVSEVVEGYADRRATHWDRDYDSIESYLDSVEENRSRWGDIVGTFGPPAADLDPRTRPFLETESVIANRVTVRLMENYRLRGQAIVARPRGDGPFPLVICLHGAASSPERTFGFLDAADHYHGYARALLDEGYAVLAPRFINGDGSRDRSEALAQWLGKTVFGLERRIVSAFLEYLDGRSAGDTDRIGMWGLSMGGTSTLFLPPLEPRIDVAICSGFFNRRPKINALEDRRWGNFWPAGNNVHFSVPGWLEAYSDADLVSLICPRPFMAQMGASDTIAWLPDVREEFANAREHYDRLGLGNRIALDDHAGGHEIRLESGLAFLEEHL